VFGNIYNDSVPGQIYHVHLEGGKTLLADPPEQFSTTIFYYWLLNIEVPEMDLEVIPDGAIDLVVSPSVPNFSAVYPPAINKFTIPLKGPIYYAGISFEPEAAQQFFAKDMKFLSNLEPGISTTQALDLERLASKIQGVTDIKNIQSIFNQELKEKKFQPTKRYGQSAYQFFVENLQSSGKLEVAQRLGVSERQFRRSMHDISGLSPKKVQRIIRLQQLLHELFNSQNLVHSEDGYYDDSHRIKETKELIGKTYKEIQEMAEIYNKTKL